MKPLNKSSIALVVLTALTSTSVLASPVNFDANDNYGGTVDIMHIHGSSGHTYNLDVIDQNAATAKVTADKAAADLAVTKKQVEDNRTNTATNSTRIKHLETEAAVVNGQAQQLRNDLNVATKALSVLGGNVQQVQGQIGNFVTKPDFKTDQDRQDATITKNTSDIALKADKTDLDAVKTDVAKNTQGVADNKTAIAAETTRATGEEQRIEGLVTTNTQQIAANTAAAAKAQKQADDNKTDIATNTAAIATKVDDATFKADQQRQDAETAKNATAIQTVDDKVGILSPIVNNNTQGVQDNKTAIAAKVDQTTFKADQDRQDALITNKADAAALKADEVRIAQNKTAIDTEVQTEQQHYQTLQTGVAQAQSTGAYAKSRADQAYANADANHQALVNTNQRLASDEQTLANHEQRITDLEKKDQVHFDKLEHQQNKDRKEFRSGIAGAMALTSIPQAPASDTAGFGMGVGTFNGENAMAAGVSARVSQHVSVKTGLSWDSSGNVGAGAGFLVSY